MERLVCRAFRGIPGFGLCMSGLVNGRLGAFSPTEATGPAIRSRSVGV